MAFVEWQEKLTIKDCNQMLCYRNSDLVKKRDNELNNNAENCFTVESCCVKSAGVLMFDWQSLNPTTCQDIGFPSILPKFCPDNPRWTHT